MQSITQIQSSTVVKTTVSNVLSGNGIGITSTTTTTGGKKMRSGKSKFRFSPLRKVAKTAKINLNRYWGLLSQLYGNSGTTTPTTTTTIDNLKKSSGISSAAAFAEEMEQNRLNELIEAETHASSQNSLNNQYEEENYHLSFRSSSSISSSPSNNLEPIHGFVRQRCYHNHSLYSSSSSFTSSLSFEEDDDIEIIDMVVNNNSDSMSQVSFQL